MKSQKNENDPRERGDLTARSAEAALTRFRKLAYVLYVRTGAIAPLRGSRGATLIPSCRTKGCDGLQLRAIYAGLESELRRFFFEGRRSFFPSGEVGADRGAVPYQNAKSADNRLHSVLTASPVSRTPFKETRSRSTGKGSASNSYWCARQLGQKKEGSCLPVAVNNGCGATSNLSTKPRKSTRDMQRGNLPAVAQVRREQGESGGATSTFRESAY